MIKLIIIKHRISIWPQEIGLQFEEVVNIQKIQFLSHQCKIATIIELFVGNVPERQHQSYGQAEFKRLGYNLFICKI